MGRKNTITDILKIQNYLLFKEKKWDSLFKILKMTSFLFL